MATASWTLPKLALRFLCGPMLLAGGLAGADAELRDDRLHAQGVTTVAIRGTVRMADGSDPEGARVVVLSAATGFELETDVWRGAFLIQGLEPGGPYSITIRQIGALARRWDEVYLTLGEPLELEAILEPAPVQLDSVVVVSGNPTHLSCCHGGTATTLSDSLVHRLPSLNRDVYDFLRLVPQLSTRTGFGRGVSAGGVGFRLNSFLTNGVSERSLAGGQPQEFAGGRSLPFEAVSEYQVLVAPFDVRYGDFAGAVVNTVTRSGTNSFQGSVFAVGRSEALARSGDFAPYDRWQLGMSLSGPIIRDRVRFFVASELQRVESPMVGPYLGQPDGASPPVPVRQPDVDRLASTLAAQYGLEAGSGGAVDNRNRMSSVFARLDASLPRWNSRAAVWVNDSDTRDWRFSRAATQPFSLSSTAFDQVFGARTVALQLFTGLRSGGDGGHNELSISRRSLPFAGEPVTRQPIVRVAVPAASGVGQTTVVTGTPVQVQGGSARTWQVILRDDLTLPLGDAHVASIGLESEWFHIGGSGLQNGYGTWTFAGLDALSAGQASRYDLARDFGSATRPLSGGQLAAYAGDDWRVSPRLSLTMGVRGDLLAVHERAPYNPLVDSLFGRRTDQPVPRKLHLSPRVGFTWDPSGARRHQLRGGVGIFTGRPPLAWFHSTVRNHGDGVRLLACGSRPTDQGAPPPFDPDPFNPPGTCEGAGAPSQGDVELASPDLRLARVLRAVLAYERRLPGGFVGTLEGIATRNLSDFAFVNLNLAGPQATDSRGRVLYGTFDSTGRATPTQVTDRLPSVIDLRNMSRNHSLQLSASVAKEFDAGFAATASYTWSRVRDVQTPLRVNTRGFENWQLRAVSGRHDDLRPGISLNDVPHRVTLAGTWRAPWRRWLTELSLLYVGESGSPFTWLTGGVDRLGDMNADGGLNDPIYVPLSALDAGEIALTGASATPGADNSPEAQQVRVQRQRGELDQLVRRSPCLRRQRGRILERNSCREPWAHTTAASLRQTVPIGAQAVEVQLDVFNLLNLLDGDWGHRRLANPVLLEHVGQRTGPTGPEPVFRLIEEATQWTTDRAESAFQLQLGVRYRF